MTNAFSYLNSFFTVLGCARSCLSMPACLLSAQIANRMGIVNRMPRDVVNRMGFKAYAF